MVRTLGKTWLHEAKWHFTGEPHVLIHLKRNFPRIYAGEHGTVTLKDSDEVRKKVKWFLLEYPMEISDADKKALADGAGRHQTLIYRLDELIDKQYVGRPYQMAIPAREYQKVAAEMVLQRGFCLIADDLGVGKTVEGLCILTEPRALPGIVVTLAGTMPRQWRDMTWQFLPNLFTHVITKGTPYKLPKRSGKGPDLIIINYHKLTGWAETLAAYGKTVIFDEAQELRRRGSQKYDGAVHIARHMKFRAGLSATPIFNLGGEIWNVVNVLQEDAIGTWEEFVREWCHGEKADDRKAPAVHDPKALGSYLKSSHIMLRRTRKDVGRELPEITKIIQSVESDESAFDEIEDKAAALARIILSAPSGKVDNWERMRAHEEFDNKMRQATGVAKAPYVADFIRLLVEADNEPVLVFAWHRAVYDILLAKLEDLKPAMYTGSESTAQKQAALDRFVKGETNIMLMSLRSGAGVDGLQKRIRTCVFAELDWSPAMMDQDIGRIHRDGQTDKVTAFYLVSDSGSDPVISETLGLKNAQLEGIRNPGHEVIAKYQVDKSRIRELAKRYLEKSQSAKAGA